MSYWINAMGLANGPYLNLAGRTDATVTSWTPQGATVNEPATTVNKSFMNRTEIMLAIACKEVNLNVSGIQNLCDGETLDAMDQMINTNYQWHDASGPIAGETNSSYIMTASGDYYLVANDGLCVDTSDVINLTIHPNPTADFGILGTIHCDNEGPTPILNPTPAGGTYTGNGISGTDFDPSVAGAGAHTLYYDFTDVNGCSDIDSLVVDVFAQPAAPTLTLSGDVLCVTSADPGAVYEWSLDGNAIAIGFDTCLVVDTNGEYTVTCTSPEGCESDDSSPQTVSGIGIDENGLLHALTISPNPTSGIVTVQFEDLTDELTISLRDVHGRLLETKIGAESITFDLSKFDAGVYFIQSEYAGQQIVQRVIRD